MDHEGREPDGDGDADGNDNENDFAHLARPRSPSLVCSSLAWFGPGITEILQEQIVASLLGSTSTAEQPSDIAKVPKEGIAEHGRNAARLRSL
jgi:hypothetical protein